MFELTGNDSNSQAAVGMSVALDKVVSALKEDREDVAAVSVVVCSLGQDAMVRAKADVVRSLRAASVTSYVLENVEVSSLLNTSSSHRIEMINCHFFTNIVGCSLAVGEN